MQGVRDRWTQRSASSQSLPQSEDGSVVSQPVSTPPVEVELPEPEVRRQRTPEEHMRRIETCKEHIRAGDAFQIVLSQRFEMDTDATGLEIYRMLRMTNPSPYMFLINVPDESMSETSFQIVGSSPESLVQVKGRRVVTNPIAGTRPRSEAPKMAAAMTVALGSSRPMYSPCWL